jgi:ribonuclease P protein component|tara:strand:- start:108 stop:542 length:435 start_codon:yes stop_codon:yes gene_type:complete
MVLGPEWQLKVAENLLLEDEQKEEKLFQHKMVKLNSLKKSDHFKHVLKGKKVNSEYFSIFAKKNFLNSNKEKMNISFVMKKKIGNAVKRNKIKRKLKAIVLKIIKIKGAINMNYTYIVFGKEKSFAENHNKLFDVMVSSFKKIS